MQKVLMNTQYAGPSQCVAPGKVGLFSDEEAQALQAGGFGEIVAGPAAEPVAEESEAPVDEHAVDEVAERATARHGRAPGRRG